MTEQTIDVARLARSYRQLVLWVGAQLLLVILGAGLAGVEDPMTAALLATARFFALLVTAIAIAICAYRTATALRLAVPILWGLAMIIPLVNLIMILVLSSRATKACRAIGVEVGFLGPKV